MGDGLGATKTRLFGKKSGGTPNPQVKKVGITPNPDQIFASAAARAAEPGVGARGFPHFLDLWLRGTPASSNRTSQSSNRTPIIREINTK